MHYLSWTKDEFDWQISQHILPTAQSERINFFLDIIQNKPSGLDPLVAMQLLASRYYAKVTEALYLQKPLEQVKQLASQAAKLQIMAGAYYDITAKAVPFFCTGYNLSNERFYALLSDDETLIQWLVRHKDKIANKGLDFSKETVNTFMTYTTLLAIEGKDWEQVKERSQVQLVLNKKLDIEERKIPEHEFLIALADHDVESMKASLNKLLKPGRVANVVAYDSLPYLDFYLHPQVIFYGKLASRHGFDLGIDDEIAPKALIQYAPLQNYPNAYPFMDAYCWQDPYEFQSQWIERYSS